MKYLLFILAPLAFMALPGCRTDKKDSGKNNDSLAKISDNIVRLSNEQLDAFAISVSSLEKKTISSTLRLNGRTEVPPQNRASISSALGGYVASINLLPGKSFRKGEILAVLEDNQFIQLQQDYLTAMVQLQSAAPNYTRQKELNKSQSVSDKAMQSAETEYRSLLITEKALGEKLRLININPATLTPENIRRTINIYAPFNGVVNRVLVHTGKYVAPSDVLFELINPDDLLLNLKVFEKDWPLIAVGQTIEAYTNDNPENKFTAQIIAFSRNIHEDGSADIHAKIERNNNVRIPAGAYMNALLQIRKHDAYLLPEDAVLAFEDKKYVFESLDHNTFRMREVQTGMNNEGFVEIVSPAGLERKKIVTRGAYTLLMGLKNKAGE